MSVKDDDNQHQVHVVLIPWSAFGHIMPFFQFSIALAKAGIRSSLVSTSRNIHRLPTLPPDAADMVNLVGLPRPSMDPSLLPEDAEATIDIPFEKIQYLKSAFDLLKDRFEEFISNSAHKPNWIFADVVTPSWLLETAEKENIPIITLYAYSASASVFFGPPEVLKSNETRLSPESLTVKPPWVEFPSTVAYKKYEAQDMYANMYEKDASGFAAGQRLGSIISGSKALALRTCHEFESEYIHLFSKITKKVVIPIGFLPPEKSTSTSDQVVVRDEYWKETFDWLDEQRERSVVFVGFGSECKLTKEQLHIIAGGLELSGIPFLWALREPTWAVDNDVLPPGFPTSVANRGVVHIGSWAPQREILAHPSINCSFFHAGWGSIIESLQHGHCLVVLPFIYDQCLNARVLVEKGLAIEVARNEEDGSFVEQDIANALTYAMLSSQGETLRAKCREAASIFGNTNLKDRYIRCFADYLRNETLGNTSHMIIKDK